MNPPSGSFAATVCPRTGAAACAVLTCESGDVQRAPVPPAIVAVFKGHRALLPSHTAALALLLGPLPFLARLRAARPRRPCAAFYPAVAWLGWVPHLLFAGWVTLPNRTA